VSSNNCTRNCKDAACCEKILQKKKRRHLSRQTAVFDFLKLSSGIHALAVALLDTADDHQLPPCISREGPALYTVICLFFNVFVK
jgi:hypothetical protein